MNLRFLFLAGCLLGVAQAETSSFAASSSSLDSTHTFFRGGATRAAWGAQPTKQKITVRTPRQQQQQQMPRDKQKETKEAMDAFLTRDSRTTFIGRSQLAMPRRSVVPTNKISLFVLLHYPCIDIRFQVAFMAF